MILGWTDSGEPSRLDPLDTTLRAARERRRRMIAGAVAPVVSLVYPSGSRPAPSPARRTVSSASIRLFADHGTLRRNLSVARPRRALCEPDPQHHNRRSHRLPAHRRKRPTRAATRPRPEGRATDPGAGSRRAGARLGADCIHQRRARVAVGGERIGLAAAASDLRRHGPAQLGAPASHAAVARTRRRVDRRPTRSCVGRPPRAQIDRAQTAASPWRSRRQTRPVQRTWCSSGARATGRLVRRVCTPGRCRSGVRSAILSA